ncbi:MAG TPA: hypothetical protein P5556_03710 [Candidatus Gastranaerophilales bacterium]|nr:hypothetical protein [Candidatus Gastranaerophilales bacterium]
MKTVKYTILALFLGILCGAIKLPASALGVHEMDSQEYLLNHGHSKEIIRMVDIQERRTLAKETDDVTNSKFKKFFRNLIYEKDITMPVKDFGFNAVSTPESPER